MKKILYMASALMALALAACNNELSDEYKYRAEVSDFTQTYKVFVSSEETRDVVPAGRPIVFSGKVNSRFGPVTAYVRYAVCTPERQEELNLGEYDIAKPSAAWTNYWNNTATLSTPSTEDGTMQVLPVPVENAVFKVTMPGQPSGSVVLLGLMVQTPYLQSFGGTTVYTVGSAVVDDPESDKPGDDENGGEGNEENGGGEQ